MPVQRTVGREARTQRDASFGLDALPADAEHPKRGVGLECSPECRRPLVAALGSPEREVRDGGVGGQLGRQRCCLASVRLERHPRLASGQHRTANGWVAMKRTLGAPSAAGAVRSALQRVCLS